MLGFWWKCTSYRWSVGAPPSLRLPLLEPATCWPQTHWYYIPPKCCYTTLCCNHQSMQTSPNKTKDMQTSEVESVWIVAGDCCTCRKVGSKGDCTVPDVSVVLGHLTLCRDRSVIVGCVFCQQCISPGARLTKEPDLICRSINKDRSLMSLSFVFRSAFKGGE